MGRGKLLGYRVEGQRRQLRRKGRPGRRRAPQEQPESGPWPRAAAPGPYLEPPCWSEASCPPRGAGGTTVSSARPLWGPSPPRRKSPGEETTGPPPSEGKIPWLEGPPRRAATPSRARGEVGAVRQSASGLEGLTPAEAPATVAPAPRRLRADLERDLGAGTACGPVTATLKH